MPEPGPVPEALTVIDRVTEPSEIVTVAGGVNDTLGLVLWIRSVVGLKRLAVTLVLFEVGEE